MTEDLLKAATRALQEETDSDSADGRFTRARVMASLHQSKVKRRTRLAFVLPIAACLAAGTAWAGATGRLPAVFHAISEAVRFEPRPAAPAAKSGHPAAKKRVEAPAPLPAADAPPPAAPPEAEPAPPTKVAPAPSSKPAPSSSGALADRDGDLYRLAHEAHFSGHDYARALPAWEAYLRAAPSGRLATEARYNRAICLLRLGRTEEARTALKPFALGALGYRQTEAQQLLNELPEPLGNAAETRDP
ncbi:MAG: tetratricopeptide repeat protein [Myxococcales bacterium]|nr:MAG: tetratricopeptide repeat protein [Myxococcales bacterium]